MDAVNPLGFDKQGPYRAGGRRGQRRRSRPPRCCRTARVTAAFHHMSAPLLNDLSVARLAPGVLVLGEGKDREATDTVQALAELDPRRPRRVRAAGCATPARWRRSARTSSRSTAATGRTPGSRVTDLYEDGAPATAGRSLPAEVACRVVSLVPSLTESVAATAPGLLVGATDYCTHPADLDVAGSAGSKYPDLDRGTGAAPGPRAGQRGGEPVLRRRGAAGRRDRGLGDRPDPL